MPEFTHEFTCAACGRSFCEARSEAEANAEAEDIWGVKQASSRADFVRVCDDCFHRMNPADNPEQHAAALAELHPNKGNA